MEPKNQPLSVCAPIGVYRTTGLPLVLGCGIGVVMAASEIIIPSAEWLTDTSRTLGHKAILTAVGALAIGMGYCVAAGLIRGRVLLYDDAIETTGALRRRRLAKTDILGKAMIWK